MRSLMDSILYGMHFLFLATSRARGFGILMDPESSFFASLVFTRIDSRKLKISTRVLCVRSVKNQEFHSFLLFSSGWGQYGSDISKGMSFFMCFEGSSYFVWFKKSVKSRFNQSMTEHPFIPFACSVDNFLEWNFCVFLIAKLFAAILILECIFVHFRRSEQCMKCILKMQFRCIIGQFTYLNSFFGIPFFCPFLVPPRSQLVLSYRLISFNSEVILYSFRLVVNKRVKFKKNSGKRYKNSFRFWLNPIKKTFSSFSVFLGLLAGFTLLVHSGLSLVVYTPNIEVWIFDFLLINKTVFIFPLDFSKDFGSIERG